MRSDEAKDRVFGAFAKLARALASPYRLRILELLAQGERTVEGVTASTPLTFKNASAHLRVLREARLVRARQEGRFVVYSLAGDEVVGLLRGLEGVAAKRSPDVREIEREFFRPPGAPEVLGIDQLEARLGEPRLVLIDARPVDEYRAGHLPGAISMPLTELVDRLDELPRDAPIVVYCRGPYCVWTVEAHDLLLARGFRARRAGFGVPDWRLAGRPVSRMDDTPAHRGAR